MNEDYLNKYWQEVYQRGTGQSELDPVCCPGHSIYFNRLIDHFQRISFCKSLKSIGNIKGFNVLDIGCGRGRWTKLFSQKEAIVTGIDSSEIAIRRNRQEFPDIQFEHMDAGQLAFADNHFDLISSVTVLQHLPHSKKKMVISQISRCIKQGGYLIILEKIYQPKHVKLEMAKQISFPLSPEGWILLVEKYGFKLLNTHRHLFLPLINNFYIPLERKVAFLFKRIFKIFSSEHNPQYDKSEPNESEPKKKHILGKIESNINYWAHLFLTFPSYVIEYILLYLLKIDTWTWQDLLGNHQAFVFKKEK